MKLHQVLSKYKHRSKGKTNIDSQREGHHHLFYSHPSLPAFERFSPLSASIELPLPDKYQVLLEQYKHLDFLVCHTHNNGGISTFEKVQSVIQQKTRRYESIDLLVDFLFN